MRKRGLMVILTMFMTLSVGVNSVSAATATATLNSAENKVKTSYSKCKGYTVYYLNGYEKHSETGDYENYKKQVSTSITGTYSYSFESHTGYKFVLKHKETRLVYSVYVSGVNMLEMVVTK